MWGTGIQVVGASGQPTREQWSHPKFCRNRQPLLAAHVAETKEATGQFQPRAHGGIPGRGHRHGALWVRVRSSDKIEAPVPFLKKGGKHTWAPPSLSNPPSVPPNSQSSWQPVDREAGRSLQREALPAAISTKG